jgi:hypothetical protein
MGKKTERQIDESANSSLLEEAAKLFALAGGYRLPIARLSLNQAIWISGPWPWSPVAKMEGKDQEHVM